MPAIPLLSTEVYIIIEPLSLGLAVIRHETNRLSSRWKSTSHARNAYSAGDCGLLFIILLSKMMYILIVLVYQLFLLCGSFLNAFSLLAIKSPLLITWFCLSAMGPLHHATTQTHVWKKSIGIKLSLFPQQGMGTWERWRRQERVASHLSHTITGTSWISNSHFHTRPMARDNLNFLHSWTLVDPIFSVCSQISSI